MIISFIGTGKMASALASGISASFKDAIFSVYDISVQSLSSFADKITHCQVASSISAALENADVAFISVKPQNFPEIRKEISCYKKNLVSIMAGISIKSIEDSCPNASVVRVMPNTPCLVGAMAAGFSKGTRTSPEQAALVKSLLETSGIALEVPETQLDAVTALSGSGPAFIAIICKYFIESGIELGLDQYTARKLFLQTVTGTVALLEKNSLDIDMLVDMVTSKGGTTAAGRNILENSDFAKVISETLMAAKQRSEELGR